MSRPMLHSLGQHDPDLATVFSRWYTGSTTLRMHYDGSYAHIQASSGINQGCPLSPCGFAAAVAPTSRYILSETQRTLDSGAKLWAFLDDWYIWIQPAFQDKAKAKQTLKCLGAHLRIAGDSEGSAVELRGRASIAALP